MDFVTPEGAAVIDILARPTRASAQKRAQKPAPESQTTTPLDQELFDIGKNLVPEFPLCSNISDSCKWSIGYSTQTRSSNSFSKYLTSFISFNMKVS